MGAVDTSVKVAGIGFKSPIMVSSSEVAFNPAQCETLVQRPIGGIITKTFTTEPQNRIRLRPYQFPLNRFGKGYGGTLFSLAAPHVEDAEPVLHHVRRMAEICHGASMVLIASYFEDPDDIPLWIQRGKMFQAAGADMLELNFSSPSAVKAFAKSAGRSSEIIARVRDSVSVPVGLKLSPTLEPLEDLVQSWTDCGLDFITAHNAPGGILIDVEMMVPFGAPCIGGYVAGRSFLPYSLARVIRIRRATSIPVIGVGGIYEGDDALQYLLAGCPLVGVGSALYFHGPKRLDDIYQSMTEWMFGKGFKSISEFQGKVFPMILDASLLKSDEKYPFSMPPNCPYVPVIDHEQCIRCRACVNACIYGALIFVEEEQTVRTLEDRCWSCGFCVGVCRAGAVELRERSNRKTVVWNNHGTASPFTKSV